MNYEIGSFIPLELHKSGEYFNEKDGIIRLNSARAGIFHACRILGCKSVYIPFYLCPTVSEFLIKHNLEVIYYSINENFEPKETNQIKGTAFLIVNYFGIISEEKITSIALKFNNVIIDNSAAFYSLPIENCYNIYSARKFFGVPDGCYVIGKEASKFLEEYDQDYSSSTSAFLMSRLEHGLSTTYNERMKNEERINNSGVLKMSALTRSLLESIDYYYVREKRQFNFYYAHDLFKELNKINPTFYCSKTCAPLVYPLVIEKTELVDSLKTYHIYTGRLWKHVLSMVNQTSFEAWLSKFLIPLPIDHRYGKEDLDYCHRIIGKESNQVGREKNL